MTEAFGRPTDDFGGEAAVRQRVMDARVAALKHCDGGHTVYDQCPECERFVLGYFEGYDEGRTDW